VGLLSVAWSGRGAHDQSPWYTRFAPTGARWHYALTKEGKGKGIQSCSIGACMPIFRKSTVAKLPPVAAGTRTPLTRQERVYEVWRPRYAMIHLFQTLIRSPGGSATRGGRAPSQRAAEVRARGGGLFFLKRLAHRVSIWVRLLSETSEVIEGHPSGGIEETNPGEDSHLCCLRPQGREAPLSRPRPRA
jgi:hypothetical protein